MNGINDRCLDVNVEPANMGRSSSAGVILVQRRKQWASISPTLDQRLVFTGDRLDVVKRAVDSFLGMCFSKNLS